MRKLWSHIFLTNRFFIVVASLAFLMVLGHFFYPVFQLAQILFSVFVVFFVVDLFLLFHRGSSAKMYGNRILPERFSNGDMNKVTVCVRSKFSYPVDISLIDELPAQFQIRNFNYNFRLKPFKDKTISFDLQPVQRGEYHFGALNVFAKNTIGLLSRRFIFDTDAMVKVYPSFVEMKKFELLAISNRLTEIGVKKIRKIGHQMEFDQIRDYILGDDYRTINWQATARKGHLMVNQYQDEKSQQVFSLLDMGRSMKMPFEGMSLLDYAINTSLVISNIAMLKHDKAGVVTFSDHIHTMLPAARNGRHMQKIMEVLYNQETQYLEHNLELLFSQVKRKLHNRCLLILYTNFESLSSAKRQIPFLQALAKNHMLVVVFFENTEVVNMTEKPAHSVEEIYIKTVAEKFIFDKRLIVTELSKYGIQSVLTKPGDLTVSTINKYLEIKARGLL